MRKYSTALIYASIVAGAVALVAGIEAIQQVQHGYRLKNSFILEAVGTVLFYFALVFFVVAKFPAGPTRALLAISEFFSLKRLLTPIQRLSFLVMLMGLAALFFTSAIYYLNGNSDILEYFIGGQSWRSESYRYWLSLSLLALTVGFFGSFLYQLTFEPLAAWVRGAEERKPDQ